MIAHLQCKSPVFSASADTYSPAHCHMQAIASAFKESEAEKEQVLEVASSGVLPETMTSSPSIQTQHLQLSRRANLLSAETAARALQIGADSAVHPHDSGKSASKGLSPDW